MSFTANTYYNYRDCIQKHIIPRIGGLRLLALNQGYLMKMYKEPVKQYSAISKRARTIMNTSMRYALSKRLIMTNPCEGLELSKGVKKSKYHTIIVDETKTYTLEQVKLLLEASKETRIHMQMVFADGSACCSQHVTDFAGKRAAGFVVFVHRVPSFCVLQKFWVYGQFLKTFYADTIKKIVTLLGRKVTTKFFIFCCPAGIPRPVPPSAPAQWSCDRDAMRFPRRKEERCRYRHRQRGPGLW